MNKSCEFSVYNVIRKMSYYVSVVLPHSPNGVLCPNLGPYLYTSKVGSK